MIKKLLFTIWLVACEVQVSASEFNTKMPKVDIEYFDKTNMIQALVRTKTAGDRERVVVVCKDVTTGKFSASELIEDVLTDKQVKLVPSPGMIAMLKAKITMFELAMDKK